MERKKHGFTMMEILTVIVIVAMLIAVLLPSVTMVRRKASEAQQKAQLTTIDMALLAFKADYGDYPPSELQLPDYCGAQKLAEALVGRDLLGFHPDSAWRADGKDSSGLVDVYFDPLAAPAVKEQNIKERIGTYLEPETANAFKLVALFGSGNTGLLAEDTYVLCDAFKIRRVELASGRKVRAGTPILYFKADTSSKTIDDTTTFSNNIYNIEDNSDLIDLGRLTEGGVDDTFDHLMVEDPIAPYGENFYRYDFDGGIKDSKIEAINWPHRPDSYILITAGADGEYGTDDDICNF